MNMISNWDLLRTRHWHLFLPPARPSAGELEIYGRVIKTMNGKAGLLGSTPELRMLAYQHGLKITAYDKSGDIFDQLRPDSVPVESETLIERDWLVTVADQCHDLVLADGSLNMLPKDEQPKLIERIANALRPGGVALIRIHMKIPPRYHTPTEVFEAFRLGKLTGPVFSATRTQLDMLWLNPDTDSVRFSDVTAELERLYSEGHLRDEEYSAYSALAPYNRIELHYSRREVFETTVTKWFDLRYLDSGRDYTDHEQHPVYVLRRR